MTKGPPIRGKLFLLNRAGTEWIEKSIEEDVKRGQLEKGNSDQGFQTTVDNFTVTQVGILSKLFELFGCRNLISVFQEHATLTTHVV